MASLLSWFFGSPSAPVLDKSEWRQFKLTEKTQISHNTALYRFSLPTPESELNLPIGQVRVIALIVAYLSQNSLA